MPVDHPCLEMDRTVQQLVDASLSLSLQVNKLYDSSDDLFFYARLKSDLKESMKDVTDKVFGSVADLLQYRFDARPYPEQQVWLQKDFEGRAFIDLMDGIFEKIDSILDSCKEDPKKKSTMLAVKPIVAHVTLPDEYGKRKNFSIIHALNIPRPQLDFQEPPDNSPVQRLPKLTFPKPNCTCQGKFALQMGVHPYRNELETHQYPNWVLEKGTETLFHPISETPFTFVEDEQELDRLIDRISLESVIAVDLEHHNYRSFEGFVCLMQLSTRTEDFIIDTISCRSFMHKLNGIFTNPSVLKVFHGAESDVIWLQRDFGIYVVGMFDTYYATKLLSLGGHSLSHLVRHYGGIELDKKFQLADWRIRPLPQEMLAYARSDTHYLPYIWDRIRNDLLNQGSRGYSFMRQILESSTRRCQSLYAKEKYNENEWRSIVDKCNKKLNNQQVAVIKGILHWRDTIARMEDESLHYVMPKTMVMRIAESLPNTAARIMRCFNPCPPLVKQHAQDLVLIIRNKINESNLAAGTAELILNNDVPTEPKHIKFDELGSATCGGVQAVEIEYSMPHNLKSNNDQSGSNSMITDSPRLIDRMDIEPEPLSGAKPNDGMNFEAPQTISSNNAFIGQLEMATESLNGLQKLRVSTAQETRKTFVFDDDDEMNNVSDMQIENPLIFTTLSNAFNPPSFPNSIAVSTPATNSSKQIATTDPSRQIPSKSTKPKVAMVSSFNSPQSIDDKFIASLKKPNSKSSISTSPQLPSLESTDLAREYSNSLNKAKEAEKIPDFDPNKSFQKNEPKSAGKKKKYHKRSQKSSTISVTKSK